MPNRKRTPPKPDACTCDQSRGIVCLNCQERGVVGSCWCAICFDLGSLLGEHDRQHIESCDCDCHATQEDYMGIFV